MKKPLRRRIIPALIILLGTIAIYVYVDPLVTWRIDHGTWHVPPIPRRPLELEGTLAPPCMLVVADPADPEQRGTCTITCDAGKPTCLPWLGLVLEPGKRLDGVCQCVVKAPFDGGEYRNANHDGGPSP